MGLVSLLFGFQGRINRMQYWLTGFALGAVVMMLVIGLFASVGLSLTMSKEAFVAAVLSSALALIPVLIVAIWCNTALQVKRLHDRGQSGWWVLLQWAPTAMVFMGPMGMAMAVPASWMIALGFLINLGFMPGTQGTNQFGGPPGSGSSSPQAPSFGGGPQPAAQAASSLFGAQSAMDRAIAEKARQPAPMKQAAPAAVRAPAPRTPAVAGAPASFGRRVTR